MLFIQAVVLSFALLWSMIFGGEASAKISVAPAGSLLGEMRGGLAEAGLIVRKTWGAGDTKLVTETDLGLMGRGFKAVFSFGVTGNLAETGRLRVNYFLLPQIGIDGGYNWGWPIYGLRSHLEASLAVSPRVAIFADAGIGLWAIPELPDYGLYFPLGLGVTFRFKN